VRSITLFSVPFLSSPAFVGCAIFLLATSTPVVALVFFPFDKFHHKFFLLLPRPRQQLNKYSGVRFPPFSLTRCCRRSSLPPPPPLPFSFEESVEMLPCLPPPPLFDAVGPSSSRGHKFTGFHFFPQGRNGKPDLLPSPFLPPPPPFLIKEFLFRCLVAFFPPFMGIRKVSFGLRNSPPSPFV